MGSENGLEIEAASSSHNSKRIVGFRAGAGAEYLLTQYVGISLDYIFTVYGKIRTLAQAQNTGFFDFNQVYGASAPEVKPTNQAVTAGIVLHF